MDPGFFLMLTFGLLLTGIGGRIVLTKHGIDWMYKMGIWKDQHDLIGKEVGRRIDRYSRGLRILVIGLILLIGSIAVFLFNLGIF